MPSAVDYGISDRERARLALLGDRAVVEIRWLTVSEVAQSLDVAEAEARTLIQAYAQRDSAVEGIAPHELATDIGVSVRSLSNWSERGLPGVGFRTTRVYVSPVCFEWIEQYRRQSFESAVGWARASLPARTVVRRVLGFPDDDDDV